MLGSREESGRANRLRWFGLALRLSRKNYKARCCQTTEAQKGRERPVKASVPDNLLLVFAHCLERRFGSILNEDNPPLKEQS